MPHQLAFHVPCFPLDSPLLVLFVYWDPHPFLQPDCGRRFPMVLNPEENDYRTRMVMLCDPTVLAEELEASLDGVLGEAGITLLHEASDDQFRIAPPGCGAQVQN